MFYRYQASIVERLLREPPPIAGTPDPGFYQAILKNNQDASDILANAMNYPPEDPSSDVAAFRTRRPLISLAEQAAYLIRTQREA